MREIILSIAPALPWVMGIALIWLVYEVVKVVRGRNTMLAKRVKKQKSCEEGMEEYAVDKSITKKYPEDMKAEVK